MLDRLACGDLPAKHHIALRGGDGSLLYEECLTREGFDGPYTILYHLNRPHETTAVETTHGWPVPSAVDRDAPLQKRHYRTKLLQASQVAPVDARQPLLFNADVVVSIARPQVEDPTYFANADADELLFIYEGEGTLRCALGDLHFTAGDYLYVPKGLPHRYRLEPGQPQYWLHIECIGGLALLRQWRNGVGQLTMDAPYCHRDFRRPTFVGPQDEGIRHVLYKADSRFSTVALKHSPLDVVGWDGAVYPWVFPIRNFQPRAGLVHLPPTWHGTFAARGALICSFVPRVLDFHSEAIPCPYPHTSVDCDEIIFYADGDFLSRRGIGPGSLSYHPMGLPHGPHPGAYEASIGLHKTDEVAVMLDTFGRLHPTETAAKIEDQQYGESFLSK